MKATKTEYKYIHLGEKNIPIITGSTMKIVELITSVKAYDWSPEELHENYPHLSMSKIYSALAYYWDNREEIDADMERRYQYAEKLRLEAGKSPLAKRLKGGESDRMNIALYIDENVARQITESLRQQSADILTVAEDGLSGRPEPIVFDRATELQRVLFAQDDDFLVVGNRRQVEGMSFSGVIYANQWNISIGKCVQDLEIIAKACSPTELADRVTYLPL